jgi:hypothetical protein
MAELRVSHLGRSTCDFRQNSSLDFSISNARNNASVDQEQPCSKNSQSGSPPYHLCTKRSFHPFSVSGLLEEFVEVALPEDPVDCPKIVIDDTDSSLVSSLNLVNTSKCIIGHSAERAIHRTPESGLGERGVVWGRNNALL